MTTVTDITFVPVGILVLALLVVVVGGFALVRGVAGTFRSWRRRRDEATGIEALDERLAIGEITLDEYEDARRALGR